MRKLVFFTYGFAVGMMAFATDYNNLVVLALSLLFGALVFWRLDLKDPKQSSFWSVLGLSLGLVYLFFYHSYFYQPLDEYYDKTMEIEAVVLDFPTFETYSYSVLVEVKFPKNTAKTLLYMDDQAKDLQVGDRFWTEATLQTSEETYQGERITYYTAKGITLRGAASGDLTVEPVDVVPPRHWPAYMAKWLKDGIYQVYPDRYVGTVLALVTGNRDALTDEFSSSLERTGLSHTVAVSGMHLAFLAGLLRILLPSGRRWTSFVVIFTMISFMLISGSTPSIMRATVMIVMLHIAPLLQRERDDATALAAALLLILCQNPYAVTHVGLHLSVASVAGILAFATKIQNMMVKFLHLDWEYKTNPPLKFMISGISATLGAMIITTPMVAVYFGNISLVAPISNLITLWAVSLGFAGGLVTGVLGAIDPRLGIYVSLPLLPLLEYLQWLVPLLSRNPLAAITMESEYYQGWLVFVYVIMGLFFLSKGKKSVIIPLSCGIISFMLVFCLHRQSYLSPDLSMEVFDVGQGQSILFTLGNSFIVSDCGGNSYDNPGDMVADRVQSVGRSQIDLVVLSHCHADHANGVVQLMNRVKVKYIAMPVRDPDNGIQEEIIAKCRETGTNILYIQEETHVSLGDGKNLRLYPPVGQGDVNDEGVTLLVTYEEKDILVTGDMDMKTEEILVDSFDFPDIEILVVGHHGSKYSTSNYFLDKIQAGIAVISVSSFNNYGHPTPEVMDKLESREMDVYRTDLDGKIRFTAVS